MAHAANRHAHDEDPKQNFTMLQGFEWYTPSGGTHWKWLGDQAERFAKMGITAVWIPPPYKAASDDSTGYDVYDIWDMGEFTKDPKGDKNDKNQIRTKYGTRQELEEAMKKLRENHVRSMRGCVSKSHLSLTMSATYRLRSTSTSS